MFRRFHTIALLLVFALASSVASPPIGAQVSPAAEYDTLSREITTEEDALAQVRVLLAEADRGNLLMVAPSVGFYAMDANQFTQYWLARIAAGNGTFQDFTNDLNAKRMSSLQYATELRARSNELSGSIYLKRQRQAQLVRQMEGQGGYASSAPNNSGNILGSGSSIDPTTIIGGAPASQCAGAQPYISTTLTPADAAALGQEAKACHGVSATTYYKVCYCRYYRGGCPHAYSSHGYCRAAVTQDKLGELVAGIQKAYVDACEGETNWPDCEKINFHIQAYAVGEREPADPPQATNEPPS